jgi:hypothetical protein
MIHKPEGRGFDFRRGHWIFQLASRSMTLGSTQFLTEMSTRNLSAG